jgi:hypothetical protein
MARLGEILVEMGACTAARVREALQRQVLFGGRLGTNLLDIPALGEEVLARGLERQHGTRVLFGDLRPQREALALLRPDLVDRLEIVPYQLSSRRLSVLCCDPRELAKLDEVAFATGKVVEPIVVPEARLWVLLRLHYGVERQLRGIEMEGAREGGEPAPEGEQVRGSAAGADLMDEAEFHKLYSERVPPPADPASGAAWPPLPAAAPSPPAPAGTRATWPPLPAGPAASASPVPARSVAARPTAPATPAAPPTRTTTGPPPSPATRSAPPSASPATRAGTTSTPSPARPAPAPTPPALAEDRDPFSGALVTSDELLAQLHAEARASREAAARPPPPRSAPPSPPPPPAAPLSFAEAVAELAGVADRGAIARIVLRYARSRFQRAVLLTVGGRRADGWQGLGEGLTPQHVARIHVPLDAEGLVRTVVESRSHFLGPLPRTEANIKLLRALAGGAPRNAFAMPILARGQVVNVLYADAGRGGLVDGDAVGELLILASKIAQSYDALLARAR